MGWNIGTTLWTCPKEIATKEKKIMLTSDTHGMIPSDLGLAVLGIPWLEHVWCGRGW